MQTPTCFWDVFEYTARSVLTTGDHAECEIERIVKIAAEGGRIGFYPGSRYARKILSHLEQHRPDIFARVAGVFDKSDNLNFRQDVPLYNIDQLASVDFDTLIVAASKYPLEVVADPADIDIAPKNTVITSLFTEELSQIGLEQLLAKVSQVHALLSDDKSKITYLLTWISVLLLDKDILSVYFQPVNVDFQPDGKVGYHEFNLAHITDPHLQYSLFLEMYRMEHVTPEPGDTVLDIGAYRGDTAAFFRKYVGDSGRVFAFEPDKLNYRYLAENIAANKFDNIFPIQKALMDTESCCNLISTPDSGSFLFVLKDAVDTNSYSEVEATTVDQFVRDQGIDRVDFIKSDIEGCEQEMLQGARQTIVSHCPKMALAIYHSLMDLLNIPLQIHAMNPDYELYIRHWNFENSPWEILLYANPKNRVSTL